MTGLRFRLRTLKLGQPFPRGTNSSAVAISLLVRLMVWREGRFKNMEAGAILEMLLLERLTHWSFESLGKLVRAWIELDDRSMDSNWLPVVARFSMRGMDRDLRESSNRSQALYRVGDC